MTNAQQIKIRITEVEHISKTLADAKKTDVIFEISAPNILYYRSNI